MRREIWLEVGHNLLVRGVWSVFFVVIGVFVPHIHDSALAFVGLLTSSVLLLCLALLFEYRRAKFRHRRTVI